MAMNSNLLRALNSSHAHARPILASALCGLIYAALPRLSTVAANPMICSLRLFSVFRPAPSPTRKPKPTTKADTVRPVEQRAKKILGPYKLTKEPSAASPKHMTASRAREREKKEKLTAYEGTMKELMAHVMKIKELRAELMNIPEQPKGATSPYACFVRHCYQSSAVIGRAGSVNNEVTAMWKALSDTELQQFTKEASDINQLRAAEYNEWAQAVGYITIRKINRDRVRSGKEKLASQPVCNAQSAKCQGSLLSS
ncbi:hypothetical protein BKA62DRAFT_232041 [Auriculariales sp. MPI-PUGE-AT-0066]|nr:hypothetical protein BKA62DRAFT_232041 [Auriculariales sp. MPI-PUGE-AT-0066]